MITIAEAKKKAAETRKKAVDYCKEYEDAYMFGSDMDEEMDGGIGFTPIIVLKETGETRTVTAYILQTYRDLEEEMIAEYSISGDKIEKK